MLELEERDLDVATKYLNDGEKLHQIAHDGLDILVMFTVHKVSSMSLKRHTRKQERL